MKRTLLNCLLTAAVISVNFTVAQAAPLQDIRIEGNQRIESETILSYVPVKKGEEFSDEKLDETLKSLYATGYFIDIKIERRGNTMHIHLDENPIINRLSYEGNSKLKDEIIEQEIKLRPREVLTRAKIQDAQQRMLEIYRRMGRYGATVNPKIIKLPQNRVDLAFEINEGDVTNIRKISFVGNKAFTSAVLEEQIKSKRAKWYRFFANDDIYDPDRFTADQQEIRKFYYDNGYPDVRVVSAQAELSPDQKDFFLTFQIEEGEFYEFGSVDISSKLKNIKIDELKNVVTFDDGTEFCGQHLEATILRMTAVLGMQGYAFVHIEPIITKDPKTKKAHVKFEIQEGPRVYVEKITFVGNDRTRDHVLRREMAVHEGDAYNTETVKASERRLKNLGYFKKVEVETEPGSGPDQAHIIAKVEEQPTGEVGFSGGYSTLDGPLVNIKFVERNLMGTGRVFSSDLSLAKKRQDFNIGILEPYFLDRDLSASVNVFSTRSSRFADFTQEQTGLKFGVSYRLSRYITQNVSYRFSKERIKNDGGVSSPYMQSQKGSSYVSMLTHEIGYDRRDSAYKTSRGYRISLTTSYAGVGGTVNYLQNIVSLGWYHPVATDVTFMIKGEAGMLNKIKRELRSADRFSLGANSFRGFIYGELGPRDYCDANKTPEGAVPKHDGYGSSLGGTRYWTATAELVFPIGLPNEFGVSGAIFTDIGSLWKVGEVVQKVGGDKKIHEIHSDAHSIRVSVGAGISWDSPMGPLSIDYAIPIRRKTFDAEQRFLIGFSTRY